MPGRCPDVDNGAKHERTEIQMAVKQNLSNFWTFKMRWWVILLDIDIGNNRQQGAQACYNNHRNLHTIQMTKKLPPVSGPDCQPAIVCILLVNCLFCLFASSNYCSKSNFEHLSLNIPSRSCSNILFTTVQIIRTKLS